MGNNPFVLVSDPDLVKKLLVTQSTRPPLEFLTLLEGSNHDIASSVIINLHGDSSKVGVVMYCMYPAVLTFFFNSVCKRMCKCE